MLNAARAEQDALTLLALQAPVAGDLRVGVASLKTSPTPTAWVTWRCTSPRSPAAATPHALPEQVNGYFAEMGRIAVDLGNNAKDVVQYGDPRNAAQLRHDDDAIDDLPPIESAGTRNGNTASPPPSTSPCSAATTNASPTMPSRSDAESSSRPPEPSKPQSDPGLHPSQASRPRHVTRSGPNAIHNEAARDANEAEAYALEAVDLAQDAIDEAEHATLDAISRHGCAV